MRNLESTVHIETPLVVSKELTTISPCQINLKYEFIQPSGSYKIRGISHFIKTEISKVESNPLLKDKKIVILSNSGGNAGNAVALASTYYGVESIVVLPTAVKNRMKQKIEKNGAKVISFGDSISESEQHILDVLIPQLEEEGSYPIYCHPYNLPPVWEGHSTMVDEIKNQLLHSNKLDKLKGIVCSMGGGGLYNGIVQGLKRNGLDHVKVMTLETSECPTFDEAIKNNKITTLRNYKTIVTSLACPYISDETLNYYHSHPTRNVLVSDADGANASIQFANDLNIIVEPACGVALCSVYNDLLRKNTDFFGGLTQDDVIVVVVCGGSLSSYEDLLNFKQSYQ